MKLNRYGLPARSKKWPKTDQFQQRLGVANNKTAAALRVFNSAIESLEEAGDLAQLVEAEANLEVLQNQQIASEARVQRTQVQAQATKLKELFQ